MKALVGHIETIEDHPNAHSLDIITFVSGDFRIKLVAGKHYHVGTRGLYIAEGETVPDNIADDMWLLGKLGGPHKNIVESRTMRGIESVGLFYGDVGEYWNSEWKEGEVVEL